MATNLVFHRRANNPAHYLQTPGQAMAEGDLVKIKGKLFMFHPGFIWTLFMVEPLIKVFSVFWKFFQRFALPYAELLNASRMARKPILLELKNVCAEDVHELPSSLSHIDTYDLRLARAVKNKFHCRASIHLLWCGETGGLVFKSKKGLCRWHTWRELRGVDVITATYQLSPAPWRGADFIRRVKQASGKQLFLGGGSRGRWLKPLASRFEKAAAAADGEYLR